jgi:tRNA-2-methylthio-N6-dimethylallyladenosine synthase
MAETPAVCEQLHLPLQSGSNRVLRAMRRGYTAERYLALLADARAAIKDLAVTTDIIVGFPGETAQDFERTLEVASQAAYDSAYTFIFSPRPGTRAAQMTEMYVDPGEVADRFERLKVVIERSALARNLTRVGRIEQVIVEGPSRKDPEVLSGRTRQGKLVHFSPPEGGNLAPGTFVNVRIDRAAPHYLAGALVSSGQGTGRRVGAPIPVVAG